MPRKCHTCGLLFSSDVALRDHCKEAHPGLMDTGRRNAAYVCGVCSRPYEFRKNLYRHQRLCHKNGGDYSCGICGLKFPTPHERVRHQKTGHGMAGFPCEICGADFSRQYALQQHIKYQHTAAGHSKVRCSECSTMCHTPDDLKTHRFLRHGVQTGGKPESIINSAFKGFLTHHRFKPNKSTTYDAQLFFQDLKPKITSVLEDTLLDHPVKCVLLVRCVFHKMFDNQRVEMIPTFTSAPMRLINQADINEELDGSIQHLLSRIEEFQAYGSGWIFEEIVQADIHIGKYQPLPASQFMKLPRQLRNKKAIINIKNDDEYCFMWCILAHLFPEKKDPQRISKYKKHVQLINGKPFIAGVDFSGVNFPAGLKDVQQFEKQNTKFSINIYSTDENGVVFPYKISNHRRKHSINLLYLSAASGKQKITHFALIKSMQRLLGQKNGWSRYYCQHCLHGFSTDELLQKHLPYCNIHAAQRILMPDNGENVLQFKNHQNQMKAPYILVADFECSNTPNADGTTTHQPNSFVLYKVSAFASEWFEPIVYVGEDAAGVFADTVQEEVSWIIERQQKYKDMKDMVITREDLHQFDTAICCHICNKPLHGDKVKDHCHASGLYRGPAHRKCNMMCHVSKKIPVFLHNFSNYDLKVIVQGLRQTKQNITVIPENMERYLSMDVGNARYLDSYRFLSQSLDELVQNLKKKGIDNFVHTKRWLQLQGFDAHASILINKSPYPYEWVTGLDKLEHHGLPPKEDFFNNLKNEAIKVEDYQQACDIFNKLGMSTFKEYHKLYLTLDGLLLADVLTDLRTTSMRDSGLDPAHYFTMPNFSFDDMLKTTKVELELLTDPTMYLAIENNIRGGISVISHRYAEANNPYLDDFDDSKPTSYLMYVDAVNLYGWAMMQKLPYGMFRWMSADEIALLDVATLDDNGENCYFIEADLTYPQHLHDQHSDYPLAPEAVDITEDMLSPYSINLKSKLGVGKLAKKLVPNLLPKMKYLMHFRNLKYYLEQGLVLDKIHRVLHCKQSYWLKPYIESNTEKRKAASSDIDKNFFKLKNNSVYGMLT